VLRVDFLWCCDAEFVVWSIWINVAVGRIWTGWRHTALKMQHQHLNPGYSGLNSWGTTLTFRSLPLPTVSPTWESARLGWLLKDVRFHPWFSSWVPFPDRAVQVCNLWVRQDPRSKFGLLLDRWEGSTRAEFKWKPRAPLWSKQCWCVHGYVSDHRGACWHACDPHGGNDWMWFRHEVSNMINCTIERSASVG